MPTLPLPRTSLASLLCPSTPFLAPRLLRTPAYVAFLPSRCATPLAGQQRASYAKEARTKSRKEYPIAPREKNAFPADKASPALKKLRGACDAMSVRTLLELYPGLVATHALHRNDTRRISQALHARLRNMRDADVSVDDLTIFVQRMVSDIQKGDLPPHPYAHVHLLGFFRECERYQEGYAFWQWLVDKDQMHVSQAVYGAALELMAYGNLVSLHEMEDLYADALKRFPGVFAEYHLSPEAIVPDRSQPVAMTDIPVLLLQGILTARILAGDWSNAYLGLDTALRLFPTQVPTRYFELFMTGRPLPEAYTAFLVACRAGVLFKPSHLTGLIKQVRMGLHGAPLSERVTAVRAIANAIYAYMEAGGSLQALHVASFIRAFETVIPCLSKDGEFSGDEAKMRVIMVTAAHEFTSTLLQAGAPPDIHIFTALVLLAGKFKVPSLLEACLQDIQTAQLELQPVDIRTILAAAGWLGDTSVIGKYWTRIASDAEARGEPLDYDDWVTFARACSRCDQLPYFKEQFYKYEHMLSESLKLRLTFLSETKPPKGRSADEYSEQNMDLAAFTAEIDALRSQVKNIAAVILSGQPLDLRKTPFYMSLDPARPPLGSRSDLRKVYDELTLDPHQPAPPHGTTTPALSPTGIPFDELRYQNWVSVLEMLNHARLHVSTGNKAPFGGVVPDGLPLKLDNLRETIQALRTSVPYIRRVAHEFRAPLVKLPNRPASMSSEDHIANASSDSLETEDVKPLIHRVSIGGQKDRQGRVRRISTGPTPPSDESPAIEHTTSPVPRVFKGEGLTKPPTLSYYIALQNDHEAPDPATSKKRSARPMVRKHHAHPLGLLKAEKATRQQQPTPPDMPS